MIIINYISNSLNQWKILFMAGFWEKQVKKYQRGKGIKHKTDNAKRTPQRSGGMSERQIQLKLELLKNTRYAGIDFSMIPIENINKHDRK